VYVAKEIKDNGGLIKDGLPLQQWSVRGEGTGDRTTTAENWGRYQNGADMLTNWPKIGVVINATAIDTSEDGAPLPTDFAGYYLEAQSQLEPSPDGPPALAFPNYQGQLPPQ